MRSTMAASANGGLRDVVEGCSDHSTEVLVGVNSLRIGHYGLQVLHGADVVLPARADARIRPRVTIVQYRAESVQKSIEKSRVLMRALSVTCVHAYNLVSMVSC